MILWFEGRCGLQIDRIRPIVTITGSHQRTCVFGALCIDGRQFFRQYESFNQYTLGLFSSPLIPSLRYLASQSEVHVLLLCSSFATQAGIIPSPSTLRTSNSLSFSLARDSFLYRVSNSPLLRLKTHSAKQINE